MKPKRIAAVLAAFSILLCGCSSQKNPPGGNPSGGNQEPPQTEAVTPELDSLPDDGDPAPEGDTAVEYEDTDDELTEETPEAPVDESAFEWRVRPFLEADDVYPLSVSAGAGAYGDFIASDYMLISRGGKVGLMTRGGDVMLEPETTRAYSCVNDSGDRHVLFTDGDPDSGDRICFCVMTGALIRTADDVCTLCGGDLRAGGSGVAALYDTEKKVFGVMPAETVRSAKAGDSLPLADSFVMSGASVPGSAAALGFVLPDDFISSEVSGNGTLDGSFGVVRNGRAMTSFKYRNATDFKDGVAAFQQDGKWGYLNKAGRLVLPFEYDAAFPYSYTKDGAPEMLPYLPSEGYIALNQNGRAGYSNLKGETVIPVGTFAAARPVFDGQAWAKQQGSGLWGLAAFGAAVTGEAPVQQQQEEAPALTPYHAVNGEGWQEAYADLLRTAGTGETLQFSLCMVDGDDVPELVLHWYDRNGFVQENEDVEMYTYYNGSISDLGNVSCDGYCTCKYLPQKQIVLVGGMREDVALYEFRKLEGGELTTVCSFSMIMTGDRVKYMIDGNECSKDTYVGRWKEYYNGDVSYDGGMYHNTEENIVGILGVEAPAE